MARAQLQEPAELQRHVWVHAAKLGQAGVGYVDLVAGVEVQRHTIEEPVAVDLNAYARVATQRRVSLCESGGYDALRCSRCEPATQ